MARLPKVNLAPIPPNLVGWTIEGEPLNADPLPEQEFSFDFISVHHPDETEISVSDFLERAKALEGAASIRYAQWLLQHPEKIPETLQNKLLLFVTVLGSHNKMRGLAGLYCFSAIEGVEAHWRLIFYQLGKSNDPIEYQELLNRDSLVVCLK